MIAAGTNRGIAWQPQPGSQKLFLLCRQFECLLHGNRGGGKSLAMLLDFCQHVGPVRFEGHRANFGTAWKGVIFRRNFPDLSDMITKSLDWIPRTFPEAKFVSSPQPEWHFATGERLMFRAIERRADFLKFQGHEYPFIGFEELTGWPDDYLYKQMITCCRASRPGIPFKIRSTTNPSGPGHNWVKKRFQLPGPPDQKIGRLIKAVGEEDRISIRCSLDENRALLAVVPNYAERVRMGATSEAQLRAWVYGDWDIIAGGMFDDLWTPAVHIVPSFPVRAIPSSWSLDRAYDHGSAKPFSVGWYAQSSGEPFEWEGRVMGTVPGDVFRIAEWYGSPNRSNEGLRLTAIQIADGIQDREQDLGLWGLVKPGPADSQIFSPSDPGRPSVHQEFLKVGVSFIPADKGPGSRKAGWELMRQRLRGAFPAMDGTRQDPGLFICERCIDAIEKLPALPRSDRDMDDVDTESEDHIGDEVRYRVRRKRPVQAVSSWR